MRKRLKLGVRDFAQRALIRRDDQKLGVGHLLDRLSRWRLGNPHARAGASSEMQITTNASPDAFASGARPCLEGLERLTRQLIQFGSAHVQPGICWNDTE